MKIETVHASNGDFDEVQVNVGEFVWINDGRGKLVSVYFAQDHLSITSYGKTPVSFSCGAGTKLDFSTLGG